MDVATHERVAKFRGARTPVKSDNTFMPLLFTRTLRLKVRGEAYSWLNAAAVDVNEVFNYCNDTSLKAATRTDLKRKWMSGFDLCNLTAGAIHLFVDTRTALASQLARALPRIKTGRCNLGLLAQEGIRDRYGCERQCHPRGRTADGPGRYQSMRSRRHLVRPQTRDPQGEPAEGLTLQPKDQHVWM
jgi:hypothetical protein